MEGMCSLTWRSRLDFVYLHCNSIKDINDLLLEYTDLFNDYDSINVFTLDGTLNYVLSLFIDKLKYFAENNGE